MKEDKEDKAMYRAVVKEMRSLLWSLLFVFIMFTATFSTIRHYGINLLRSICIFLCLYALVAYYPLDGQADHGATAEERAYRDCRIKAKTQVKKEITAFLLVLQIVLWLLLYEEVIVFDDPPSY